MPPPVPPATPTPASSLFSAPTEPFLTPEVLPFPHRKGILLGIRKQTLHSLARAAFPERSELRPPWGHWLFLAPILLITQPSSVPELGLASGMVDLGGRTKPYAGSRTPPLPEGSLRCFRWRILYSIPTIGAIGNPPFEQNVDL